MQGLQHLGLYKLYIDGHTDDGKLLNYIFGLPFLEPDVLHRLIIL